MRILISSGEASGDTYGAQLIEALQRREPKLEIFGAGGERMRAAGCDTVVYAKDISVVGLAEVLTHLPRIYREYKKLLREIDRRPPDAAVLIDFPDWNFRLARELHGRGIPVAYYVSPQLWAWRPGRIEEVKKYVRRMLVIFPFEAAWYRERGVEAEYLGHPLIDVPAPQLPQRMASKTVIGILPGSRRKEIAMNLPALLEAAKQLGSDFEFLLPVASTIRAEWVRQLIHRALGENSALDVKLEADARSVLAQSRAAIVASGTATVEATLIGTPFVMVYRVSPVSYKFGRRLVKVPFFAMPNLIAGREVVPELVQDDFTPSKVVAALRAIIAHGPPREKMLSGFAEIRQKLAIPGKGTAAERAADQVLQMLVTSPSAPPKSAG